MERITHFHDWITRFIFRLGSPLPGLLVMDGAAGSGKTTLLKTWLSMLEQMRDGKIPLRNELFDDDPRIAKLCDETLLMTAKYRETSARFARRLLFDELRQYPYSRTTSDLWDEAANELFSRSYIHVELLIIDQAERLSCPLLEDLHAYLVSERVCSLLLVGTTKLTSTLARHSSLSNAVLTSKSIDQFDKPL